MACSMALRTPTPRKSTDRQCGQRGSESILCLIETSVCAAPPLGSFRGTACLTVSAYLLRRPQIGFGKSHVLFRAGSVALVSFRQSFIHTSLLLRRRHKEGASEGEQHESDCAYDL